MTDTGLGIPRAEQADLFNRFFRGTNAIEKAIPGSGLGLAISQVIAEAHGGTIQVESTPAPDRPSASCSRSPLGEQKPTRGFEPPTPSLRVKCSTS